MAYRLVRTLVYKRGVGIIYAYTGYLVRFNMGKHYHRNQLNMRNRMYYSNNNMMTARLRYRDAGKYRESYHATRYF